MEPVLTFLTAIIWQAIVIALLVALYRSGIIKKLTELEVTPSGVKLKLAEMQGNQERLQKDVDALRFLVSGFVTDWEFTHLQKLGSEQPFDYQWGGENDDRFIQEMIRLWDFGMVTRQNIKSWYDLPRSGNLNDYSTITDRGREYLRLRHQIQGEPVAGQVKKDE